MPYRQLLIPPLALAIVTLPLGGLLYLLGWLRDPSVSLLAVLIAVSPGPAAFGIASQVISGRRDSPRIYRLVLATAANMAILVVGTVALTFFGWLDDPTSRRLRSLLVAMLGVTTYMAAWRLLGGRWTS